ncbi:hypothetical protein IF2G_06277 [Cordyceps javanica]|nr:hypothetical protein IF2G_06277 [Cordyceps javanica]
MRKQRIRRELAGCPGPSFAQDDELGVEPVRETIAEQSRWVRQPMVIESLVGVGVDDGWEGGAARTKLAGGRRAGHRMLGRRRSGSCCGLPCPEYSVYCHVPTYLYCILSRRTTHKQAGFL